VAEPERGPSRDDQPCSAEEPVMSETSDIDRVWEIAEKIKICMLTTHAAGRMRCRPMHAIADRAADCLWFVTDDRGAKDNEIGAAPDVCLAFADTHSNAYLSVTGQAELSRDPAKARELWSSEAQAWWPNGPGDPVVRVLRVVPDSAEFWDARGNAITVALKLAAARLTGGPPNLGEAKKVRMG
jgi:general stress protein 26